MNCLEALARNMLEVIYYLRNTLFIAVMDAKHNKYKGEMETIPGKGELSRSGKGEMQYYDGSYYEGDWL